MTIDERLRHAADDLKARAVGPVPDLPFRSRAGRALTTWAAVALLVVGAIWAIGTRGTAPGDTLPVSTETGSLPALDPVTSVATAASAPTTAVATSTVAPTTSLPVLEPTVPSTRRLTLQEIPDWFGAFTMEPQTVDVVLGTTGTATYTLATTPTSFCIRTDTGSGCSFTSDGSTLFDHPMSLPFIGSNIEASGRWTLTVLAPLDVQLRLISNSTPACELQPFTLQPYADVALWACESTSPAPFWYTLEGVRGDDTVYVDQFSSGKPDVQTGEQMLAEMFGANCLQGADGQPVNFVARTIDLDHIPSPVEETGARIGPTAGQDIPERHPSEAEYWIPVGIGDEIVGYSYVPNDFLRTTSDGFDFDCHPEVAIYDEEGELIGGFYNGAPAIIDRL